MRVYEYGYSIRTLRVLKRATIKKWSVQNTRQLATAASLHVERYDIACGISGRITLELHNSFLLRKSPKTPLVIYLPPYPSSPLPPLHPPSWLLNSYPVLNIPYRWSHNPSISFRNQKSHSFPIPLHDTLRAYTWLLNSYLPSLSLEPTPPNSSDSDYPPKAIQRPLLIYGSYLGGTLATSLALTESFVSSYLPTRIHSLIVHNGIFDWTPISTTPDPSIFPSESSNYSSPNPSPTSLSTTELYVRSPWTNLTLHALKTRLFPFPSQTFDPFASPILFFRRPGIGVPKRWPIPPPPPSSSSNPSLSSFTPTSATENPIFPDPEFDLMEPDDFSPYPSSSPETSDTPSILPEEENEPHEPLQESPKSNLIFPPRKSSLQIPRSLFTYTSSSPQHNLEHEHENENENKDIFKTQAQELTNLMRRSIRLHELKKRDSWEEGCNKEAIARERVRCVKVGDARGREDRGGDGKWKVPGESGVGGFIETHHEGVAERGELVRGWIEEGGL